MTSSPASERPVTRDQLIDISETLVAIAMGDFAARLQRTNDGSMFDVLAYLVNNMAAEVGEILELQRQQQSRIDAIVGAMVDGLIVLQHDGRIARTNAAFATLLGVERESLVGRLMAECVRGDVSGLMSGVGSADEVATGTLQFVTSDGSVLPLSVTASRLEHADGTREVVLVARDLRLFDEAREKIGLYEELRKTQARLVQSAKLAALGELASAVAHEVNNPLQVIGGLAGFLAEDLEEAIADTSSRNDALGKVEGINQAVSKCAGITRQLLDFARQGNVDRREIDLARVTHSTLQLISHKLRTQGVETQVRLEAPLWVVGHEGQLSQVILNLLVNAAQSVGRAGLIQVDGKTEGDEVCLSVTDDGAGISREDLSRVFDPFFTTKGLGEGTGLGLSVSFGIIQAHAGTLSVDSAGPGRGATFTIRLKSEQPSTSSKGGAAP